MPDYLFYQQRRYFPWDHAQVDQPPIMEAGTEVIDPGKVLFPEAIPRQVRAPGWVYEAFPYTVLPSFALTLWMEAAQHQATIDGISAADAPIFVVDFLDLKRVFGTHPIPEVPALEFDLDDVLQGSLGTISITLDEKEDLARLGGASVRLLNEGHLLDTFAPQRLEQAKVQILLGFVGLGYIHFSPLFTGTVDRYVYTLAFLSLALVDPSITENINLSVPLGGQYLPGTPQDNRSRHIPILTGGVIDAPTIQVTGNATGTLAEAIGALATSLFIVEFGAPFPATGTFTLNTETNITYTSRSIVAVGLKTYLQLSGLTRPNAVVHAAGETATLTHVVYTYLIAYEIASFASVTTVRENGIVLPSAQYTYSVNTTAADRPVSLLTFSPLTATTLSISATDQSLNDSANGLGNFLPGQVIRLQGFANAANNVERTIKTVAVGKLTFLNSGLVTEAAGPSVTVTVIRGAITVDITIPITNLLTSGGFETGDTTGWTVGTGATAIVGTSNPNPAEGTYRLALEGSQDIFREFWQEVSTLIGQQYFLRFFYRAMLSPNVLLNGSFESGIGPNWVVGYTQNGQVTTTTMPTGYTGYEGTNVLVFTPAGSPPEHGLAFLLDLYQDVTVTPDTPHSLTFAHLSTLFTPPAGATQFGRVGYAIGTPQDPQAYVPWTAVPYSYVRNMQTGQNQGSATAFATIAPVPFTPTTATVRVTIIAASAGGEVGASVRPFPPGLVATGTPNIYVDNVRVANDLFSRSEAGFAVGAPTNPDLQITTTLPHQDGWTEVQQLFTAVNATTRVTFRSRYLTAIALPVHLDKVELVLASLRDGNPADVIRSIIETYMPASRIDLPSFVQAHDALIGWHFNGYIPDPGDADVLVKRMARQCGSLLLHNARGEYRLTVLDDSRPVVFVFDETNIIDGSFSGESLPVDTIYTSIYVYFSTRPASNTSRQDFSGSAFVTPETTNHLARSDLIMECAAALAVTKRENRLEVYADFIDDIATAFLFLEWLVARHVQIGTLIEFGTWLDALPLKIGQRVAVSYPALLAGTAQVIGEIRGWFFDPGRMEFRAKVRTFQPFPPVPSGPAVPEKSVGTVLLAWQDIAAGAQVISSVINVTTKWAIAFNIQLGRATGTPFVDGWPQIRVEASGLGSGNQAWTPLTTLGPAAGASIVNTTLNGAISAGATTCIVTAATNIAIGDVLFLGHTTDVTKYELVRVTALSGTTVIFEEACTNAHDNGALVTDQAEHHLRSIDASLYSRMRVVIDNAGNTQALAVQVLYSLLDSL